MKFHPLASITEEVAVSTAEEFAARRKGVAFIVEPVSPGRSEPGSTELHAAARVCWHEGSATSAAQIRIGRDPEAELPLPHPRVSRLHASFRFLGFDGVKWVVEDTKSANGTTLKGHHLSPGTITPVANGDRVLLGEAVCVRPFFDASALHAFLKTAVLGTSAPSGNVVSRHARPTTAPTQNPALLETQTD